MSNPWLLIVGALLVGGLVGSATTYTLVTDMPTVSPSPIIHTPLGSPAASQALPTSSPTILEPTPETILQKIKQIFGTPTPAPVNIDCQQVQATCSGPWAPADASVCQKACAQCPGACAPGPAASTDCTQVKQWCGAGPWETEEQASLCGAVCSNRNHPCAHFCGR